MSKKIIMLSTGGTIASKRNPDTGLLTAGVMTGEELSKKCEIPKDIEIEIISVFQIPSNHMTFEHLWTLKNKIDEIFLNEDVTGVVITHGTDTLEETSYFLDLVISDNRPIVVTGSQRGPDVVGTDAFVNLRQAFLLAASQVLISTGVLVLFNEQIFSARYVEKKHASNLDGFGSKGYGHLGIVDQEEIYIYQKPVKRHSYKIIKKLPEIEIIKTSLGSDGKFIKCAVEHQVSGIIIEAPGRGHAPPKILDSVDSAISHDIPVLLTTSASNGFVKTVYDFPGSAWSLQERGVILARDYDSKKARIKLAVLLSSGIEKIEKEHFMD